MKRNIKENAIVLIIISLSLIAVIAINQLGFKSYNRFETDSLHYDRGEVVEVIDEQITYDKKLKIYLGTQDLKVKMTEGESKGKTIEVTNYITKVHQVIAKNNMSLIINIDSPTSVKPFYSVYNYDRSSSMIACVILLFAAIIWIGGGKGIKSILGLVYSLFIIIGILLPTVFSGYSPIIMSIVTAILSTTVTLLLLNGQSRKTFAAIISTTVGVFFALILFTVMSWMIHIDGFSSSEAEGLVLIQEATGLKIKDVLFAGVLIASLGAIMDVGMSIVSALYEVYRHNTSLSARELFKSGIEIGKDMIGTMTNTLILAFTGSAFITLLVFISYKVQFNQLLNSNFMSIEIAQGLCGTFGIVLTIPTASAIAAFMLTKTKFKSKHFN